MATGGLDAAIQAAGRFVDLLDLPKDQVALVSFSTNARLVAPLGSSEPEVQAALQALRNEPGTRIDHGLSKAFLHLLGGPSRPANTPVIVLLTDGSQQEGRQATLDIASEARLLNIRIYTIGLGNGIDAAFLSEIAGRSERAFLAPSIEDLDRIYAEVAGQIPCDLDGFWGRR